LVQALDTFKTPPRKELINKPLRALISANLTEGPRGCEICATVLQGYCKVGRDVALVTASGGVATVKKIVSSSDGSLLSILLPGEQGTLTLIDRNGRSGEEMGLWAGCVLSTNRQSNKGGARAHMHSKFKATILTMPTLQVPLLPGTRCDLYIHGEEVLCHVSKLYGLKKSETSMTVNPKRVSASMSAHVKIVTDVPVCLESYNKCAALGRFVLRFQGQTIAVGIVENTKKKL
jgi:translation elongation factor EF-1alpha